MTQSNPAIEKDLAIIQNQHLPVTLESLSNEVELIQYFRAKCLGTRSGIIYIFHIHPTKLYPQEKPQIFLVSPQIAFSPAFHDFQDPYSCAAPITFLPAAQWIPTMTIRDIMSQLQRWVEKYDQTALNL